MELARGRTHEVRGILDRLRRLTGDSAARWKAVGRLCRLVGDTQSALQAFARAIGLQPADADSQLAQAELLREAGRPAEAVDHAEAACRLAPDNPEPAHLMGIMYLEQGMTAAAVRWLLRARAAGGNSAGLNADLGLALQTEGRLEEAEVAYERSLAMEPTNEAALRGLARLAQLRRTPQAGLQILEPRAASINNGGLLAELAGLMMAVGRSDEAVELLESRLPDLRDPEGRMEVHFRLAALYDDRDDVEAAMQHLLAANRAKRADFDPQHYAGLVDRLLAVFDRRGMARLPRAGHGDGRPVFIVGMPRSGTSLVEQILASHSRVHGAGELPDMGLLALSTASHGREYPESVRSLSRAQVESLAAVYRQRLDGLAPQARRITDKMWQNFEFLGFAALLFPESRVIHCTRDPMDTALSCFFHHFYGGGVAFAYDLGHLGAYYRQYRRIMDHWRKVLPLPIMEVNYEHLVEAPEAAIREIVAFAGLEWEPSCLRFFETDRVVRTASFDQVRRPIYRTSVGRARRYARWLEPFVQALERSA